MSDWSSDVCSSDLDAVVFDHRVGEQLGAHRVEIGLAGAVGDVELDEAPRAHVRHAAEPQPLERMMDRLALRVEHPRLERHIDIHCHGGGPFAARAGRWARLCPRITSGARGGRALSLGKTRLYGLRTGRIFLVANRSHYP